jgi:hypothetical protein
MIKSIDFKDDRLVKELYELQRAAYLIEARLINFYDIPPLKETIDELTECDETFFGYFEENSLVGALSYTIDGQELTICRMMVRFILIIFVKGLRKSSCMLWRKGMGISPFLK